MIKKRLNLLNNIIIEKNLKKLEKIRKIFISWINLFNYLLSVLIASVCFNIL